MTVLARGGRLLTISNMRSVTVREVCREFSRKGEAPLRRGETLVLRKRREALGRIVPEGAHGRDYPDIAARQKKILGNRRIHLDVAEILLKERNRL